MFAQFSPLRLSILKMTKDCAGLQREGPPFSGINSLALGPLRPVLLPPGSLFAAWPSATQALRTLGTTTCSEPQAEVCRGKTHIVAEAQKKQKREEEEEDKEDRARKRNKEDK